jgi:hypothetical protein
VFTANSIAAAIYWGAAATSSFVISSGVDSVVDTHEVHVFSKLGDDFICAVPLSLSFYHCDIHEAFLRGGVYWLAT